MRKIDVRLVVADARTVPPPPILPPWALRCAAGQGAYKLGLLPAAHGVGIERREMSIFVACSAAERTPKMRRRELVLQLELRARKRRVNRAWNAVGKHVAAIEGRSANAEPPV